MKYLILILSFHIFANSGQLEVLVFDNHEDGHLKATYEYYLKNQEGRVELSSDVFPQLKNGKTGDMVSLSENGLEIVEPIGSKAIRYGHRSMLFIVVDFLDHKASEKYSLDSLTKALFTNEESFANYIEMASFKEQGVIRDHDNNGEEDIVEKVQIDINRTCDIRLIQNKATLATKDLGYDTDSFDHLVFIVDGLNCGWGGVAEVGGRISWVQVATNPFIYAHEIGHNYGMLHSGKGTAEYGDKSCPMGGDWTLSHYNPGHVHELKWGHKRDGYVVPVSENGEFELETLGEDKLNAHGYLVIDKKETNEEIFVSYRLKKGLDRRLKSAYANKVSVHIKKKGIHKKTFHLKSLGVGESFTDDSLALEISVLELGETAVVKVNFGTQECVPNALAMSLKGNKDKVELGDEVNYVVSVKNNDNNFCDARNVSIDLVDNESFEGNLNTELNLQPGEEKEVSFKMKPLIVGDLAFELNVAGESLVGKLNVLSDEVCDKNLKVKFVKQWAYLTGPSKSDFIELQVSNPNDCAVEDSILLKNNRKRISFSHPESIALEGGESTNIKIHLKSTFKRVRKKKRKFRFFIGKIRYTGYFVR